MAELADLSREINGQIDTRLAKLKALLDAADRTIARFEMTMGHPEKPSSSKKSGSDHNQQENRNNLTTTDHVTRNQREPDAETKTILDMAHQGLSVVSIAQKLGRPIGEIELIIALHKN